MTPEGKIKAKVKALLTEYNIYFFMPVQMGYGAAGLDFHCVLKAKHDLPFPFFIETKAQGSKPTARQEVLINKLRKEFNCKVWIIDSEGDIKELELWLFSVAPKSIK